MRSKTSLYPVLSLSGVRARFALLALALLTATRAPAALILADTTSTNTSLDFFPVANLSSTSGMDLGSGVAGQLDIADRFTGIAGSGNAWVTDGRGGNNPTFQDYFFGAGAGPAPVLVFGFAAAISLDSVAIWNYPATGGGARGSARLIDIAVDTGSGFTTVASNQLLSIGNGTSTAPEVIPLGALSGVSAVRITITDNYFDGVAAGGDRVGMGTVAFNAVPEPSSLALATLALSATFCRRRLG